jgi:hypothetical protein
MAGVAGSVAAVVYFAQRSLNHELNGTEWAVYAKTYGAKQPSVGSRKLRFGDDGKLTFKEMQIVVEGRYRLGPKNEVKLEIPNLSSGNNPEVNTTDSEVRNLNTTREIFVHNGKLTIFFADGAICECVPLSHRAPMPSGRQLAHLDQIAKGNLPEPHKASQPVSYAFASSTGNDYVLKGETICFDSTGFEVYGAKQVVSVKVHEWETSGWDFRFEVGPDQSIGPGRYKAPLRQGPRDLQPRVILSGANRTGNKTVGEFAIWEFEVDAKHKVTRLAVDFVLRGNSGKGPLCFGAVRFNSSFE